MEILKVLKDIVFCLKPGYFQEIVEREEGGIGGALFAILLSCLLGIGIFAGLRGIVLGSAFLFSVVLLFAAAAVALYFKSFATSWAYSKFSVSKKPVNAGKLFYQVSLVFSALFFVIAIVFSFLPMEPIYFGVLLFLSVVYYTALVFKANLPDIANVARTTENLFLRGAMGFADLIALLIILAGMFGAVSMLAV